MSKRVSINVSIVEDDPKAREILVDWINRTEGFRCVSNHGSGEDALTLLPELQPQVVLMDINLPGMNGPECVRRLKPLLPQTQFMVLTVYEDSDHIFQALQAGAAGYLLKQTQRAARARRRLATSAATGAGKFARPCARCSRSSASRRR